MNLAEVLAVEISLSENNSLLCYDDILCQGWRCYSPEHSHGGAAEVDRLIGRYLNAHASMPSWVTGETLATGPLETFRCPWGKYVLHGALFMNGAVVQCRNGDAPPYNILFIAEAPAVAWGYPKDYVVVPPPP